MMEVLIGHPGCKVISLGQRVTALSQVISYFPGGTKGEMLCPDLGIEFFFFPYQKLIC